MNSDDMKFDLVCIGAGIGGLTAGLRAQELGLKAIVVEKGPAGDYPCNTRYSGGHLSICMSNPADPADVISDRIVNVTKGFVDRDFAMTYAGTAERMLKWLGANGAKYLRISNDPGRQWVLAPPRRGQPGLDWKGRGPDVLLQRMAELFQKTGGTLIYNTTALNLLSDDGAITGVKVRHNNGTTYDVHAKATVIADGGFQSNDDFVRQFICKSPEKLLQRNARSANGDGLRMAIDAGAQLTGMKWFYGHPLSVDAFNNDKLWPHPYLDILTTSGIVVNRAGERIVDEGKGAVYLSNVLAHSDDPLDSFVIFDSEVWNGPASDVSLAPIPNPTLRTAGATIHEASNIEDLAKASGISIDRLRETVDAYNASFINQSHNGLTPPRTTSKFKAYPILKAPFYAMPMCVGITHTMGGPKVDADGHVLNEDNQPIGGLFAVGSAAGGIEGGEDVGYVGGLAKGAILGLRAAEAVSASLGR